MKPLLTIGIPTYNRPDHLNERLIDLKNKGYLNHPDVQIIVHDNDSQDKKHIYEIRMAQKKVKNLLLIESRPNVGMVKGCEKIIRASLGKWIILLGDDDPILLSATKVLLLIRHSGNADSIFFKTKLNSVNGLASLDWFPSCEERVYPTSRLCAQMGFTTLFAFLGGHAFRRIPRMADRWMSAHCDCMYYGHVVMLLQYYRATAFSHRAMAAYNPGNERIPQQMNFLRLLELKTLLQKPKDPAISRFLKLRPKEVTAQGTRLLADHTCHPHLNFLNRLEIKNTRKKIYLKKVETLVFDAKKPIYLGSSKNLKPSAYSATFLFPLHSASRSRSRELQVGLQFACGLDASPLDILTIIAKLRLEGDILREGKKISVLNYYLSALNPVSLKEGKGLRRTWVMARLAGVLFASTLLYGPAGFYPDQLILNHLERPRRGFYKIILGTEKVLRSLVRVIFPRNMCR
jgi:glycosyltransferase involved in cell wall biosynthesis